jgi:hypothetical protein
MPLNSQRDEFSNGATELLQSIALTAPRIPDVFEVDLGQLVAYIAGTLDRAGAGNVEAAAVQDANLRRRLVQLAPTIDAFKRIPYAELLSASVSDLEMRARHEWLKIIDGHVKLVTTHLRETPPTRWLALSAMAKQGPEGLTAFKTIWRALFTQPVRGVAADGLLRLGFGYRRSELAPDQASLDIGIGSPWSIDSADFVTQFFGQVHPNGDVEISAAVRPETKADSLFVSFSMSGRTLALTEGKIVDGRVRVVLEGLADILRLPVGPLSQEALSARTGGWPEQCEIGQIVVESGPRRPPYLGLPTVRDGWLELTGYFEESEIGGKWELSVAVSPNSWQVLHRFDIKGVIERPQVLQAALPKTALDGPFGGALLLKRLGPTIV